MKMTFLGTRGYIDAKTRRHGRHTSTLVSHKGKRVMIDCGLDWTDSLFELNPDAIIITHAHPDHAGGLKEQGAPCPVFATKKVWGDMERFGVVVHDDQKKILDEYEAIMIQGISFATFPVVHSTRVSAVGYRITAGAKTIFCVHDVVEIKEQAEALKNIDLYIGDGASIVRPLIRQKEGKRFGHASIEMQLNWCEDEGVSRAIFTHCGSQIVEGDERLLGPKVKRLGKERGVDASIAYDEWEVVV